MHFGNKYAKKLFLGGSPHARSNIVDHNLIFIHRECSQNKRYPSLNFDFFLSTT